MITREELYELVWSTSVSNAARQFGVSDVYMARICGKMDVPRPSRGYPALQKVGRAPGRPPLPEWQPGTQRAWSRDRAAAQPRPPRPRPPSGVEPHQRRERRGTHPLVAEAAAQIEAARPAAGSGYLIPRRKLVADVTTTKDCLKKSLRFANALFNALESRGHRVRVAPAFEIFIRIPIGSREYHGLRVPGDELPWSPMRPTVAYVFGVPVGVAIVELSERIPTQYIGHGRFVRKRDYRPAEHVGPTWESVRVMPTGRLKLVAYSPFRDFRGRALWLEQPRSPLEDRLETIIAQIQLGAIELGDRLEAAGRYFDPVSR